MDYLSMYVIVLIAFGIYLFIRLNKNNLKPFGVQANRVNKMNKNVENANGKLFMAVVIPYKNQGEDKLILHEVTIRDGEPTYGDKDMLIISPESVLLIKKYPKVKPDYISTQNEKS